MGALSITATNAGAAALACAISETTSTEILIGHSVERDGENASVVSDYLTIDPIDPLFPGVVEEVDFQKECKNYTKFRKIFRKEIKTTHEYCAGVGEKCEYSGSPGCGWEWDINQPTGEELRCNCEIEFTYCTETATSNKVRDSKRGK